MKNSQDNKNKNKDINLINLLNTNTDVSSGMHMPSGINMWSKPTVNMVLDDDDDDENEIKKEALGLLDIPTSLYGGEVLTFDGTHQNPGLSRENGNEVDFFGAVEDVSNKPPNGPLYYFDEIHSEDEGESEKIDEEEKFIINFPYKEEVDVIKSMNSFNDSWGKKMKTEIEALERFLKKQAGLYGVTVGVLAGLLPGVSFIPMPVRAIVGGLAGSAIEDYFDERPKEKTILLQQAMQVEAAKKNLTSYGLTEQEINKLSDHSLTPDSLIDEMKSRGARMPVSWTATLQKIAQQYVMASDKLLSLFKQAHSQTERVPESFSARGRIVRVGDPYTYDKDPESDAYIVVSAPPGKESVIGRKIMPGTSGYDLIKASDPDANQVAPTNKQLSLKEYELGLSLASKKDYSSAIEAFQKSFDLEPTANALFNLGKSQLDSGNLSSALDTYKKYKESYPEEWDKNQSLVPQEIKSLMSKPISLEDTLTEKDSLPDEFKATKENISLVLSNFLKGVPLRVQTSEGTSTVMDSAKVRNLTEGYIKGISGIKSPQDGLQLTVDGLEKDFAAAIESGLKQVMDRGTSDKKQLSGVFNGLVWQALRRGWAKWKNAPLKDHPTEQSEQRRVKRIDNQDERLKNKAEHQARRDSAKREARKLVVKEIIKAATKK